MRNNGQAFCFVNDPDGRFISLPEAVAHLTLFSKTDDFEWLLVEQYLDVEAAPWLELRQTLANGEFSAYLQQRSSGRCIEIPRTYWLQERHHVAPMCLSNMEHLPGYDASMDRQPIFINQDELYELVRILQTVAEQKRELQASEAADTSNPVDLTTPVRSSAKAGYDCKVWLERQFATSDNAHLTREKFWSLALLEISAGLSRRAFRRAWSEAVANFPERARSGRKRTDR